MTETPQSPQSPPEVAERPMDQISTSGENSPLPIKSDDLPTVTTGQTLFHEGKKTYADKELPQRLISKLNQVRKSSKAQFCDVVLECRDGHTISAHGCVLFNYCKLVPTSNNIKLDLDYESVELIVDFCYTGQLPMSTENIVDLSKAAELLKLSGGASEAMERFLVKNLPIMSSRKELITQLSEETIRRALAYPERVNKLSYWWLVLFTWWEHDRVNWSNAYCEFMHLFEVNDINRCMSSRHDLNFCFLNLKRSGDPPEQAEEPSGLPVGGLSQGFNLNTISTNQGFNSRGITGDSDSVRPPLPAAAAAAVPLPPAAALAPASAALKFSGFTSSAFPTVPKVATAPSLNSRGIFGDSDSVRPPLPAAAAAAALAPASAALKFSGFTSSAFPTVPKVATAPSLNSRGIFGDSDSVRPPLPAAAAAVPLPPAAALAPASAALKFSGFTSSAFPTVPKVTTAPSLNSRGIFGDSDSVRPPLPPAAAAVPLPPAAALAPASAALKFSGFTSSAFPTVPKVATAPSLNSRGIFGDSDSVRPPLPAAAAAAVPLPAAAALAPASAAHETGAEDDVSHSILHCPALEEARTELTQDYASVRDMIEDMLESAEKWARGLHRIEKS